MTEALATWRRPSVIVGGAIVVVAFLVYWAANRLYDAGRGDLFYLADALLNGRTWIDVRLGPWDIIEAGERIYVPFPPFPAILLMPLVAITGPVVADQWESGINAALAAIDVGLGWWLVGRLGVQRPLSRFWLVLLLGFSTQLLWVTTRGGVWHTGHLVATMLTLAILIELAGSKRPWLVGLLAGAAFLTRPPLAFAVPVYALFYLPDDWRLRVSDMAAAIRSMPWRRWTLLALGVLPSVLFFLWYNAARFGSPFVSGYELAALPDWLAAQRDRGMFALVHVPMNLDYLLWHLPAPIPEFPWFRPDGLGMSVLITSPGLLLAAWAPWRDRRSWLLLGAAVLVLIPTLLYYGGGWLQYGYRYFLDSVPFVFALCAVAVARLGRVPWPARLAIVWGVAIGLVGIYWAYNL